MKREIIVCFILLGMISLVFAQANGNQIQASNSGENIQNQVNARNYIGENGQQIQIQEGTTSRNRLRVGNISADYDCNLTQERIQNKTKLKISLSNGRNAEIKIMPDVASETALSRLRLKTCSEENECQIELKEVGKGNQTRVAYEIKTQRQSKFLGLFKTRMKVQAQVDAETGEVIQTKKPWWAFLASEPVEETIIG